MEILRMAWRNVWRNRRRTTVTVAAMTLALLAMVLYAALMEGYILGMKRNVLDLEMGDVQVFAKGYRDDPSIYTRIEASHALITRLEQIGYDACARMLAGGLAAAGESSAGVTFRGLEPDRDAKVSHIGKHVALGEWLSTDHPKEVVLGRRLAHTLNVKPGDELAALSQATDGSMASELYSVRGILKGISDATDRTGLFMIAEEFRELFLLPQGAHQIIVRRPREVELAVALSTVKDQAKGLDVKSWRELMPTIASMIDSMHGLMMTVSLIVYIAVGILILNAMLMVVFERIREIGVLKALGVGPGRVLSLIVAESAVQTVMAVLGGLALSGPGLWYLTKVGINMGSLGGVSVMGLAMDPVWRAKVSVNTFASPVLTLVIIVFFAVLYPALKAAWIRPVEAMRHQ